MRPFLATIGSLLLVFYATSGVADDPSVESTEFETAPALVFGDSIDVLSMVLSPQGHHIYAGFQDGSVMTLDRTTRQPIRSVQCHAGPVSDLAVSDSGEMLVTAGYDGTVKTWRLPSFEPVKTFSTHTGRVTAIALSVDGRTMASCGVDKTIRIRLVDSEVERGNLTGHDSAVRDVNFSPDGLTLASAGDDGIVRLWDVNTLQQISVRSGHAGRVRAVQHSPDGQSLAAVGEDGTVLLWNALNDNAEAQLLTHTTMIWNLAFSPGGALLATGDADGAIQLWDLHNELEMTSLDGHRDTITTLSFARDSKTLFSASHDGTLKAWNARLPRRPGLATMSIESGKVWATAVCPRTSHVAVGGKHGFIRVLDLTTGMQVTAMAENHPATVDCLEYSVDGQRIASAGWKSDKIIVWDAAAGTPQQTFKADGNVRAISFSPDGRQIAAGCEDQQLLIWNVESGKLLKKIGAHAQPVYDVSYSADGKTIATCCGHWNESKPGRIKLWHADSLTEYARLEGHQVAVRAVVFSPEGGQLASVSEDGVIRIWDVASQTETALLQNSSAARTLDWSPDGKLLAVGLQDGTTNVWNMDSDTIIRRFGGDEDTFSVRFSTDGSILCGAGGEKRITFWDTSDLNVNAESGRSVDSVRSVESVRRWAKGTP